MSQEQSRANFFRQSGWMIIANTVSGFFMAAVHPFASAMPPGEYSVFFTLLRVFTIFAIPAAGLQTIMAQQAAASSARNQEGTLAATLRQVLIATSVLWLLLVLITAFYHSTIVQKFQIANPMVLWVTLLTILLALWMPIFQGVLQGRENFLWLGWSMIFNGVGRVVAIILIVWGLKGQATGAMTGAMCGVASAILIAFWPSRTMLHEKGDPVQINQWLGKTIWLICGIAPGLLLVNLDMIVIQSYFSREVTPYYAAGAMIGYALVTFTTPIAAVMFPKIVKSVVGAQKTDALFLAVLGTGILGGVGAIFCTFFPELPLRIIFFKNPDYIKAAPLVPWFIWAFVPLTMANVLISNLLARERFAAIPLLALIGIAYPFALFSYMPIGVKLPAFVAFERIVQILGFFSLALFTIALLFTLYDKRMTQLPKTESES
ncbi:MAG: hypothetical protein SFY81_06420 [Verrucomicrobiota bacterium]|nr:hypothetical protein [Verrucomicrobiota bacterium]